MVIKLKDKLRSFLRNFYSWYVSSDVKTKTKKLYNNIINVFSFSWYKELDEKEKDDLHYMLMRGLAFVILFTGVLCIAFACINFKDIFYINSYDKINDYKDHEYKGSVNGYFLPDWAHYQWEWDKDTEKPIFIEEFKKKISEAYDEGETVKPLSVDENDFFVNKFVTNGYRFFLVENNADKDSKVLLSNWDYYMYYYAARLKPGVKFTLDESDKSNEKMLVQVNINDLFDDLDPQIPSTVREIYEIYQEIYIYKYPDSIKVGSENTGRELDLYIAISSFNIIDEEVGKQSIVLALIGMAVSLFGVVMNSRLSGTYSKKNGKMNVFNRKTITTLLATYLVGGFTILAAIFFIWYVGVSYGSYDSKSKIYWTICLAILYAVFTFITTSMIGNGLSAAHENAQLLKKLKAELIANVSHDIKTPLTSIIGYINLLENEDTLSKDAKYYVSVLKNKSERLKNIVSDLFELSKSTSGNSDLTLENLDLKKLIVQTLADMEDSIAGSDLSIKQNLPAGGVFIKADGKKLYRVFQNVVDNAIKYSLTDTPVYIACRLTSKKAIVEIQNTASYEMNFTEEDVLARYTRGSGLMPEEGIGLGLSIADTFVKECGGEFRIKVAGDQFKVIIEFKILL